MMPNRARTVFWPVLVALLSLLAVMSPAHGDEALKASKTEFAVGETITVDIPGVTGLIKPKWQVSPSGIVSFVDKGRTQAEVKGLKPGKVTVSAKVKGLLGATTYTIELTVKTASGWRGRGAQSAGGKDGQPSGEAGSRTTSGALDDAAMGRIGDLIRRYEVELAGAGLLDRFKKQDATTEGRKPSLTEAEASRLGAISESFLKDLSRQGYGLEDLQRFKSQFMAAGPGGSPLFPGQGGWNDAFLGTERAIMMGRAQLVQRLWMETLQDTFKANPDAAVFGQIDIGSWVKMRLGDLGFQADIDFSSVSVDPDFNLWLVNQFQSKLDAHTELDMVRADALLTPHGAATADVFIGDWGKTFAELDMLRRSKWKVIRVEKDGNGNLILDENGRPKIRMVERAGSQLFWEVAFRKLQAGQAAEVEFPKMDLTKEPMLSLEMLRHAIHDIEHGPYERGQKLIKMLKYAERSYFMSKKAVAEFGFNPYAENNPRLARAAEVIIANKNNPAIVADALEVLAGKEITAENVEFVVEKELIPLAKTAMMDNAARALAFRLNAIAKIDSDDARRKAAEKLWQDLGTELDTFRNTSGEPPRVMVQAQEMARAVMEGKLPAADLEAKANDLHKLLNDAYKLPDSVIDRILLSDSYLKVRAYLRKLGWVEKSIDDFIKKARQKYPNGADFYDKFQALNDQLNKTTAGSALLKGADFADNAFTVYESYMSAADANEALWNASLALGRVGLQEAFPSLQIPLAIYDGFRSGSPAPVAMAVAFYYFPFAGQVYMISQQMQRADVAIRDAEFYAALNKMLDVTEFDTQGKITGFRLKNILGKEIDRADINPPGNRKAIIDLFSDPGGTFFTSPNFRYWASLVPRKDDRFGLYENKLGKLRRFFGLSEDVRYMTLMLEQFRAQSGKMPQDPYTAQREAALTRMEEQLTEIIWVAMADMLESAAKSVQSSELEAKVKQLEDELNLGDDDLGQSKGLLSRIKWEIRQNSSLFSGENPYAVGLVYERYLKAYERVKDLRRAIYLDIWSTGFGMDIAAAQGRPMKLLLMGGRTGAPALTGDPAKDVELAERTVAIHKKRADKIRTDLAGALGRDIDPSRDKEHLKALGQMGMEWEHLLDDCAERAAGNCQGDVRTALRERLDRYKAYLAQLAAGIQPISLGITGPTELEAGESADYRVRFDKDEDRNRPGLALRWSVDGQDRGNGEKFGLRTGKTDKAGSLNIVLTAWVGQDREARKLGEASLLVTLKDARSDKDAGDDKAFMAGIDAALAARDWQTLNDKLEATRKDQDLRLKHTKRYDARMQALNDALRTLKDERMKWLLAWEGYIRELERVDNLAYDTLKQEVEKQVVQYQNRCFEQGSDPAHLRGERCQKEAYAYEEKCLPKAQRDAHWAEQKRIRSARNLLPDEVHLMHSTGFPTYRAWFEKVEALAKAHGLPFPYPEPVATRIRYVSQCAKLEDVKSTKKLDELTGLKVRLKGPNAPVPLGKPVTVTASASGGKGPYAYEWSGAAGSGTRATLTPAWAGDWTVSVTVRDAEGKGGEASVTIMVSPMKIRLVGAKGQVFYGSQAKLSTEGMGLEMPAPVPDDCAGKPRGTNPFDECGKIEVTAPPVSTCSLNDPFCVDTSHQGTVSYSGKGDPTALPPKQEGMTYDPNLVQALPDSGPAPTSQAPKPGAYQIVWQSEPGLTFDPPKSDKGATKVTYDRMGQVKLWCELLQFKEGDFHTVGECEQETITVVAPKFSATFTPADGQAKIGQEVRARINTQPGVPPKLIDYRWLEPATSNRMEYTENAGEIGFKVKDAKTLVLKALARVPGHGDEIGTVEATYTGAAYEVKAWVVEPGTRPMMWDPKNGGLVPVPKGSYATFERIGLRAEVQGGPAEGVRWQWTVNEGTSISNPISQTPTVSRSEAGSISARVVARDANGIELGNAEVGLSVIQVSDQPPKPNPAEEKKQRQAQARKLARQAEEQLKGGDLPGAAQTVRQARELDAGVAAPTARKVAEAAKKAGWQGVYDRDFSQVVPNLETAVDLNPNDKDAQAKLERARRFVRVWPQVEAKAREFDAQMAEKKYFTAHQTLLAMQDLQKEMPGTTEKSLHNRTMRDFNAGMAEYNAYMRQVEDTHRRTFQEKDWQAMLDNAQQALRREHSPANEKMLKGNVEFARQQLAQRAAETAKHGQAVAGTWAINGNGYSGKLEISAQDGKLSGRVWYDIHRRWEELRDVSFNGRNLVFTRPIPGATQRYTGTVAGKEFRGTFTQEGTSTVYNWSAKRADEAEPAGDIRLPPGLALATDKLSYSAGETITLRWGGIAKPAAQDWIGLYAEGAANEKYGEWHYLKAQAGGTLQFAAPQQPGVYEFRLFLNWPAGGYKDVARSPRISVGGAKIGAAAGVPVGPASVSTPSAGVAGLIAAYALDGDARDGSGNGRHGTLNGVTPTADRFGRANGAMAFNGKAWIELPIDINPGPLPQLSFTAWVRADEINPKRQVMSHDNGGYDRTLGIDYRGGGNGWSAFSGTGSVLGHQPVQQGRWTFVAGVWDQATEKVRLHVDDRMFEEAGKLGGGHATLALGRNPSFGEYFIGAMDDVRFYGRALTPSEVSAVRGERGISQADMASGPAVNVGGKWKTTEGELILNQSGNRVTGTYTNDGGEIEGEVKGHVLEGWWIENSSGQNCGVARNGRMHWGRIRWTFEGDRFDGGWSYCDGQVKPEATNWKGERIGAAPAPSASPAAPASASPSAQNNAEKSLEESVDDLKKSLKDLKGLFNW